VSGADRAARRQSPALDVSRPFANVICAMDFTEASAAGLRAATDLVRQSQGRLILFHAVEGIPRRMVLSSGEALQVQQDYATRVVAKAQRLRGLVSVRELETRQVEPIVVSGPPDRGILQAAAEIKADLIVMGVTPRSILDEVLAGSTSRVVLQRSTCPVLLVPVTAAGVPPQPDGESRLTAGRAAPADASSQAYP
jgi:nucleotide-binding universal stress UspA family protein